MRAERTNHENGIRFVLLFFLLCFAIRVAESLLLRTDQSIVGELFVHKLILGITPDGQTREPERTSAEKKIYGYGTR